MPDFVLPFVMQSRRYASVRVASHVFLSVQFGVGLPVTLKPPVPSFLWQATHSTSNFALPALASPAAALAGAAGVVAAATAVPSTAAETAKTTSATEAARSGSRSDILGNSLKEGCAGGRRRGARNRCAKPNDIRVGSRSGQLHNAASELTNASHAETS